MKKFLPLLTFIALPLTLCACNTDNEKATVNFEGYSNNIENFQKDFNEYSLNSDKQFNKLKNNKYRLSLSLVDNATLVNADDNTTQKDNNQDNCDDSICNKPAENQGNANTNAPDKDILDEQQPAILPDTSKSRPIVDLPGIQNNNIANNNKDAKDIKPNTDTKDIKDNATQNDDNLKNISTLYYLTADVDNECNNFCKLKQELNNAILETQNLIDKVYNNEISLTNEQKMFLTEQSSQLKNLGKKLSNATTELAFSVNDIGKISAVDGNLNQLALKYMLVLDNLNAGNEMLENSLYSLNMINQLMRMSAPIPGNNQGRILYGFQQNNEKPIIRDYLIDKDGKISENKTDDTQTTDNEQNSDSNSEKTENTATPWLTPNIDTYGNFMSNIDTFYNTALLNRYNGFGRNGFGYGYGGFGGGFGVPGIYGYNYPNMMPNNGYANSNLNNTLNNTNQNNQQNKNDNTTESINPMLNTQDNQRQNISKQKQNKKKFKIVKNIDTFKNADTPTPKQRFAKIKTSVNEFFAKFKKPNKDVQNPIYKYDDETPNINNMQENSATNK